MDLGDHLPVVYYTDERLYSLQNNQKKWLAVFCYIQLYMNVPTM